MALMVTQTRPITPEELLAMPDDGVRRWIIRGQLREQPSEFPEVTVTIRNRFHSAVMAVVAAELTFWRRTLPTPNGQVVCGEAGIRLPGEDGLVGVDVAYVSPEVVVELTDDSTIIHGVPTLVVEISSPNDTVEQLHEMVDIYQAAGVPLVWLIDPYFRTVTIFRLGQEPTLASGSQELTGGIELPGFAVPVNRFFE